MLKKCKIEKVNKVRKLIMAILGGVFYWLTTYLIMKLFVLLNLEYSNIVGVLLYFVIPFFFGGILIFLNKEVRYHGAAYSSIIVLVRYLITFLEVTVRTTAGPSAFEQVSFYFKALGVYSMICAVAGGLLAIFISRRRTEVIQ
jgi:hypothetical protein